MNIGVFDSGLGGLAVLREIINVLPRYNYIYFGDNIRAPYGDKSSDAILRFTKEAVDFFVRKNCALIIFACNTVTITALRKIQRQYLPQKYPGVKALGVVKPAVEEIANLNPKRIGIIGTTATVNSRHFVNELKAVFHDIRIFQKACPLLVPIIEDGLTKWRGLELMIKEYLRPLKQRRIDTLILGCTHYIWIEDKVKKCMGNKVHVVSQDGITAKKLKDYLMRHPEIESKLGKNAKRSYYFSDLNSKCLKLVKTFLGAKLGKNDRIRQS